MSKCIYIEQMSDGMVQVGFKQEPDSEEYGEGGTEPEGFDMQPADNLDAALAMARDMLTSNPEEDAANESAFQSGYKKAGGVEDLMGMGNKMDKTGGM